MLDFKKLEDSLNRCLEKEDKASIRKWFKKQKQGKKAYWKDKSFKMIRNMKNSVVIAILYGGFLYFMVILVVYGQI